MRTLLKDTYTDLYFIDENSKTEEAVFAEISQYMQRELSLKAESVYNMLMKPRRCEVHDGIMIMEICVSKLNRPYAFILCKMLKVINSDDGIINAVLIHLICDQRELGQLRPMSNLVAIIKDSKYRDNLFKAKSDNDIATLFRLFDIDRIEKRQLAA